AIAQRLFPDPQCQWAGVALLAAMFTLPVAGTALNLADQHLHPRTMATALIVLGIERMLAGRKWHSVGFVLLAVVVHPIMAAFGASFCLFLALADRVELAFAVHHKAIGATRMAGAFPLS